MNENPETQNRVPVAGLAVDACSAAFERWWRDEGSGFPPLDGEDRETHMHRVAEIAWSNGAYLERNAIVGAIRTMSVVREQNQIIRELYDLAIAYCKDRGWSKHPTIDKAHDLLSEPNIEVCRGHSEDGAKTQPKP